MTATPLVELQSISKKYGNFLLLDNVSFNLNKQEITTLIGQNGVGKTTVAKIILGLEDCDKGSVIMDHGLKIGYVPQVLELSYNIPMTASYLLQILSDCEDYSVSNIPNYFKKFDSIADKQLTQLSGGQMQSLLLAGTIMREPDLLILDEPTQFLDVVARQEFYLMIKELRDKYGMTVFMISHDLFTVMKNSDQVICLNKHVCCSGKPADIENNKDLKYALSEIGFYIHHHDHNH